MRLTNKITYATCLLTIFASGCTKKSDGNADVTPAAVKVTVANAVEKEYTPLLHFTGTAEANKEVNLGSSIPGRVEKINYSKGSFVPKGAVIAEMADEMLIQAQIELAAIEKDYERISRLKEKGSIPVMDYDHIKAKYDASQTKVRMLKKNTSITAPFGGVLVDIMVHEGENYSFVPSVSPDMKMKSGVATLMQLNPLKVNVEVNEKELNAIQKGQTVEVQFDAYPDEKIGGKIADISPILSPLTRTSTVEVTIPNNGAKLKPGMFCRTAIEMPQSNGVFVPINALYRQPGTGDEFVFVVNADNTVTRTKITRGESLGTLVHIPEIDANTVVVIDGKNKLDDGAKIEIKNP